MDFLRCRNPKKIEAVLLNKGEGTMIGHMLLKIDDLSSRQFAELTKLIDKNNKILAPAGTEFKISEHATCGEHYFVKIVKAQQDTSCSEILTNVTLEVIVSIPLRECTDRFIVSHERIDFLWRALGIFPVI